MLRGVGEREAPALLFPQTPISFGLGGVEMGGKGDTDFWVLVGSGLRWAVILSLITAAPFLGALLLGLHFTRPEMTSGRPLRNTAVGTSKPTFRPFQPCALGLKPFAHFPAPTTVYSCFSWRELSPLTNTSGVCKIAFRPHNSNRPEGKALPLRRLLWGTGNSVLCHIRYR